MYLSDRDLCWALRHGHLLVDPPPTPDQIGPNSIDLQLDNANEAKVWDIQAFVKHVSKTRKVHNDPELPIGEFDYKACADEFLKPVPVKPSPDEKVYRRGDEIIIKPGGFVLWQTKQKVGTPIQGAQLVCFVDGKSTRARTGIVVHMTAPTIHAAWGAWPITLEIGNLGPFFLVLKEGDSIAQIIVAKLTSVPERNMQESGSVTFGQTNVAADTGATNP